MTKVLDIFRPIDTDPETLQIYGDQIMDVACLTGTKPVEWSDSPKMSIFRAIGELAEQIYRDDYSKIFVATLEGCNAKQIAPELQLLVYEYGLKGRAGWDDVCPILKLGSNPTLGQPVISERLVARIDQAMQYARNGHTIPRTSHILRGHAKPIPLLGFEDMWSTPSRERVANLRNGGDLEPPHLRLGAVRMELHDIEDTNPKDYGVVV